MPPGCKHLNMLGTSQCAREWFPSKEIAEIKYLSAIQKGFVDLHIAEIFVN